MPQLLPGVFCSEVERKHKVNSAHCWCHCVNLFMLTFSNYCPSLLYLSKFHCDGRKCPILLSWHGNVAWGEISLCCSLFAAWQPNKWRHIEIDVSLKRLTCGGLLLTWPQNIGRVLLRWQLMHTRFRVRIYIYIFVFDFLVYRYPINGAFCWSAIAESIYLSFQYVTEHSTSFFSWHPFSRCFEQSRCCTILIMYLWNEHIILYIHIFFDVNLYVERFSISRPKSWVNLRYMSFV